MASVAPAVSFCLSSQQVCRIVFLEPRPAGVLLDLVATSDGGTAGAAPLALELALPWSAWAVAAAGVLELWTRDHSQLSGTVEIARGTPQLHLTDGCYSMVLDIRRSTVAVNAA